MKTLIFFLLIPFNLFAQVNVDAQIASQTFVPEVTIDSIDSETHIKAEIFVDTIYWNESRVEMWGNWRFNEDSTLTWPADTTARMAYDFWGFGIEIYLEAFEHHTYCILEIDGKEDTLIVQDSRNLRSKLTYLDHRLDYGNHRIVLRGGLFVPNKFVKLVDSNPNPQTCQDTVIVPIDSVVLVDSIVWDTVTVIKEIVVVKDTTIYNVVDSINWIDSTIYVYDTIDIKYDTIEVCLKDSIIWIPTPCPEIEDCEPVLWKTMLLVVVSVLMTLFVILYFNEKSK